MISPFLCAFTCIHAENTKRFHGFNENLWKSSLSPVMLRELPALKYLLFGGNYSIQQKEKQERSSVKHWGNDRRIRRNATSHIPEQRNPRL